MCSITFYKLEYTLTPRFEEPHWVIRYDGMFCPNNRMDKYFGLDSGIYEKTMVENFNAVVHNLISYEDKSLYYVFFKTEKDTIDALEWLQSIIMAYQLNHSEEIFILHRRR